MHPGGVRSAMDLFDFEKSANLKHPSVHTKFCEVRSIQVLFPRKRLPDQVEIFVCSGNKKIQIRAKNW